MDLYKGEVLFMQGEQGDLYYLESGLIKVVRTQEDGQLMLFNIIVPGEVFPHNSLITPAPYYGTTIAITPCKLKRISSQEWYLELEQNPYRYQEVAAHLETTLRKVQKRLEMTTVSANQRIPLFKEWISTYLSGYEIEDLLTQEEIGQFLGLRRETVNRYLKKVSK